MNNTLTADDLSIMSTKGRARKCKDGLELWKVDSEYYVMREAGNGRRFVVAKVRAVSESEVN